LYILVNKKVKKRAVSQLMTQHAQKIEAQRYEENLTAPNYSSAFCSDLLPTVSQQGFPH
jgi:hypothetical protein